MCAQASSAADAEANPARRLFDAIGAQLILAESFGAPPPMVGADYAITKILGAGGFGLICRATNTTLRREVALKIFPLGSEDDSGVREALREARSLARLEHPGIVGVYGAGESEVIAGEPLPCAYVEMQLVEGQILRDWIEAGQAADELLRVLLEAGRALAYAHENGLLHRDFKPENLMVDRQGRARVIDFGLALAADGDAGGALADWDARADAVGTRATVTGQVRGTPGYMAPEASQGRPMAASDQFAFAVVVREALTGRHPLAGPDAAVGSEPAGGAELFGRLRAVLDRAMSPAPADRYASVAELCDAIEAVLSPRRRLGWIAAGLAGLALVAAGVLVLVSADWGPWGSPGSSPDASVERLPANEDPPPAEPSRDRGAPPEPEPVATVVAPPEPVAPVADAATCADLEAWAGAWQVAAKIAWTEFSSQLEWRTEYELELSLGERCLINIEARKFPPVPEGELPGEPLEAAGAAVAMLDEEGVWRLPLRLAFAGDGRTYEPEEHYELVLTFDRDEGQVGHERLLGAFRKANAKGHPIRTGMLVGRRGVVPDLRELSPAELPCAARCRVECAGELAERSCRARACEGLDEHGDICGAPSPDFEVPLRVVVSRQLLRDGGDVFEDALSRGRATQLAQCPINARALAGRWAVWAQAAPEGAAERFELELEAEDCTLSGTAVLPDGERAPVQVSGSVTGYGTWVLTPASPVAWLPTPLIFAGVAEYAPAFGSDASEPPRSLRARKLPAREPTND